MSSNSRMGAPPKKNTMRPPPARSTSSKTLSAAINFNGRISPSASVTSNGASKARSPVHHAGTKRKEREFEEESGDETNINVFVRCRGRNEREVRENSVVAVSTDGIKGSSVELSLGPAAISHKTYRFDKVFSPAADQGMIFDEVVAPILDEVLSGFNCTIFAYGQTGTGKTYTMSGDISNTLPLSDSAGIIPRALNSLFDKLEGMENESSVKCSFIELYNEELRDLLSADENVKLKIYEDANRKRSHATLIQGVEESHIKDASKGIELLRTGSHKRQVAATKCNDLSSRSHTVFTITVYLKRSSNGEDDYVSTGKLNLVDLAGSENIQRSGAENKRAAEAGLINKSLLTLGRVINALVDKSSHIPYRESKLTRLLQDSLGGRTKTCIIATLSPAKSNLEETISTLDYAFRAKNIRNKPQVNQLLSKKTLIREFTSEIEKLKGELIATRQRNGVYLTSDTYEELMTESESRRILSEEQKDKIETMELNLRNKVHELFSITTNFHNLKKDNEAVKQAFDGTKSLLQNTEAVLAFTRKTLAEETMLREAHEHTEETLSVISHDLISTIGRTTSDIEQLHSKNRRKSELQNINRTNWRTSQTQVTNTTHALEQRINSFEIQHQNMISALSKRVQDFAKQEVCLADEAASKLKHNAQSLNDSAMEVNTQTSQAHDDMNVVLEEIQVLREDLKQKVGQGLAGLSAAAQRISAGVIAELEEFHTQLHRSYSSLGKDIKITFDDLSAQLNARQAEANNLREELSKAGTALAHANEDASRCLSDMLTEERQQAADARSRLILQITSLINQAGDEQDLRVESKVQRISTQLLAQSQQFQEKQREFELLAPELLEKDKSMVEAVTKSREAVKQKIKADWTTANQQNSSIQSTARCVHHEAVGIVDAQMKSMDVQLRAFDDILSRVQAQNGIYHDAHVKSLKGLTINVQNSYSHIGDQIASASIRKSCFQDEVISETAKISAMLKLVARELSTPLADLRQSIAASDMTEYVRTGQTPLKQQYSYTTCVPRTEPHEVLLEKSRGPKLSPSKRQASPIDLGECTSPSDFTFGSPSKTRIFTDLDNKESVYRSASVNSGAGLKELDVNVASLEKQPLNGLPTQPPSKRQNTAISAMTTKQNTGKSTTVAADHRSVVLSASIGPGATVGEMKLSKTKALAEGRENIPFSASVGPSVGGRVLRARSRS